jgi:hypothetical protein
MKRNDYLKSARQCIAWAYEAHRGGYSPVLYLATARNWIEAARLASETARVVRS